MSDAPDPTVYVVDDDEDVRNALRWLIESVNLSVECFASAEAFLESLGTERPGCLVLDVRMPGMGGLGLLEVLAERQVHLPVIVMTGHGDVPIAVRAMKAGAVDFIEKPFTDQYLLDQIQKALQEDATLRVRLSEHASIRSRVDQLTPREQEVMNRLVEGYANKAISAELGISDRTVETHRAKIMEKMQAGSFAELVRMVTLSRMSPTCT